MRSFRLLVGALLLPACSADPQVRPATGAFDIVSPTNAEIGVSGSPTFSWEPSIGATSFQVQVSTDPGFGTTVVDQSGITGTSFTPSVTLTPGTVFFWRVIATRSMDTVTSHGAPFSFTTIADTPAPFTMTSPGNGSTGVSSTPTFTWSASPGAGSFTLEVAMDPSFSNLVMARTGLGTTSAVSNVVLAPNATFFWRVTAVSTNNVVATGAPFTFVTGVMPTGFTLLSPLNGAVNELRTPNFAWTSAPGATSYTLQLSTSPNFSTFVVNQPGITTTTATPALTLLPLTTYFWRVLALTPAGTVPPDVAPFQFTTGT